MAAVFLALGLQVAAASFVVVTATSLMAGTSPEIAILRGLGGFAVFTLLGWAADVLARSAALAPGQAQAQSTAESAPDLDTQPAPIDLLAAEEETLEQEEEAAETAEAAETMATGEEPEPLGEGETEGAEPVAA